MGLRERHAIPRNKRLAGIFPGEQAPRRVQRSAALALRVPGGGTGPAIRESRRGRMRPTRDRS